MFKCANSVTVGQSRIGAHYHKHSNRTHVVREPKYLKLMKRLRGVMTTFVALFEINSVNLVMANEFSLNWPPIIYYEIGTRKNIKLINSSLLVMENFLLQLRPIFWYILVRGLHLRFFFFLLLTQKGGCYNFQKSV